jgi:3'-phosphoadenosine 5'-phosphosulfate sulfotransferase (PAPS reductase)/FAD synthetase
MNYNKSNLVQRVRSLIDNKELSPYIAFSGGKDSVVILDILDSIAPNLPIIHNPKMNTHKETIRFIYEVSLTRNIFHIPISNMDNFIKNKGFNCQIDGTRISEFNRIEKSNDFTTQGKSVSREHLPLFIDNGLFGIKHIYPIYDLKDEDVYSYIKSNNISYSDEYRLNGEIPDA